MHSSGQIIYSRWDHLGGPNKMPLFKVNPDGTGQFVLYGADETFSGRDNTSGSRTFMEARELHDGGVVASIMERTSDFEGGAICIIDLSKFTSAPSIITPSTSPYNNTQKVSQGLFKTPYPVMDGGREKILVAQSANETGGDIDGKVNYDLFIMEKTGGKPRLIHADPAYNDYDPVVLAPRAYPVIPYTMDSFVQKAIKDDVKTGMFFDANVYSRQNDGQPRDAELEGKVRFVRVLEAVSTPPQLRHVQPDHRPHRVRAPAGDRLCRRARRQLLFHRGAGQYAHARADPGRKRLDAGEPAAMDQRDAGRAPHVHGLPRRPRKRLPTSTISSSIRRTPPYRSTWGRPGNSCPDSTTPRK